MNKAQKAETPWEYKNGESYEILIVDCHSRGINVMLQKKQFDCLNPDLSHTVEIPSKLIPSLIKFLYASNAYITRNKRKRIYRWK